MASSWNVGAAVNWIRNNSSPSSQGRCAKYVRTAIEQGGVSTAGRPIAAKHYVGFLPRIGFNPIGSITGRDKQSKWSLSNAKPGDIAVMDHGTYGHICMWGGDQWYSDFKQGNRMWVYSGDGVCNIFRFAGTIDNTLSPSGSMSANTFDSEGNMLTLSQNAYVYNVERDDQQDNVLLKDIGQIYVQILKECVLDDLYAYASIVNKTELDLGDLIPNFNDVDDVMYENELTMDDSSVSESIVEKMVVKVSDGISDGMGILDYSKFGEISDYKGEFDGKIGSTAFKQGKGKVLEPNNMYDLFHTFGYGVNRSKKYTGVECCEVIIRRLMKYIDDGCSSLQNMFMMYHLGMKGTWEEAKQNMIRKGGLRDQGTGRFISAAEWITMQERYQTHGSNYMHMPLSTKPTKTKAFLFPLVTFISRQEQGVNCETAADLAFKKMNIA